MGNHPGSSPGNRTNYFKIGPCKGSVFFIIWNSWYGYRARSPDDAAGRYNRVVGKFFGNLCNNIDNFC